MKTYHSKLKGSKVYHIDPDCTVGNNIEKENIIKGDGKRRLCKICGNPKNKKKKKK